MSEISQAAKKMVRHYVGVENPQISVFSDVWHIEGDRDNAEELAQHILDLQHKHDALAAENAALIELYRQSVNELDDTCVEIGMMRGEKSMEYPAPETPATDAYLNSVRAEGVEAFAHHQRVIADSLSGAVQRSHRITACRAEDFANQLRTGEPT